MRSDRKIIVLLAILVGLSCSSSVHAAPKQMPDGNRFDAQYYAQTYPDVVAALGTDEAALYNHYLQFGKAEGRRAYAEQAAAPSPATAGASPVTDKILALKATYPDGAVWNGSSSYTTASTYANARSTATACQGFAYLVQDAAFGKQTYKRYTTGVSDFIRKKVGAGKTYTCVLGNANYVLARNSYSSNDPEWDQVMSVYNDNMWIPVYDDRTRVYDGSDSKINANFEKIWKSLQVGDMVCDANHAAVVLTKNDNGITVVEGNNNGQVKWGRRISRETMRVALYSVYSCKW
ncbi:MAG: hypothetical protein K6G16_10755 [Lachnospiraceae bacterium]|nr:hypothetical protein [Lachnospiraceae bacterium]